MLVIRAAATLQAALALGFGGGAIVTIASLSRSGELPMTPFGFRAFSGPFERLGTTVCSALLAVFTALCALDLIAARLLWQRRRPGAALGSLTAVPTFLLSLGFALPIMLVGIPVRVILMIRGRRTLS